MNDTNSEQPVDSSNDAAEPLAVSSDYKVLGQLNDSTGIGILGQNDAGSGTPIGVKGVVPNSSSGFGLETPDDAKVGGALETTTVRTAGSDLRFRTGTTGTGDAANVVAGHGDNTVGDGAVGVTIGGGGFNDGNDDETSTAFDNYATISGGRYHQAGTDDSDPTSSEYATVGGGWWNRAKGSSSTISGGQNNKVTRSRATIGGGMQNVNEGQQGVIGGGAGNDISAFGGVISGGVNNATAGRHATIGGGQYNDVSADYGTVSGGGSTDGTDATGNAVYDDHGTVGGGGNNQAGSDDANTTTATFATVAGGERNTANGTKATVAGGSGNTASGDTSTVGGGANNTAGQDNATVAGGQNNDATGYRSFVGGGSSNKAAGNNASAVGGNQSEANGTNSFAAGRQAKANDSGAFVWADNNAAPFASDSGLGPTGTDTFNVRCIGGARFGTSIDSNDDIDAGVQLASGSGSWSSLSAAAYKSNVESVDNLSVLEKVEQLDVSSWEYDGQDGVEHMGPMAGEFHDRFGLGSDEESIATVDADGVALAAIKGLAERLDEENDRLKEQLSHRDERIEEVEAECEQLRDRLSALEERID